MSTDHRGCACTDLVADATCPDHGVLAFLRGVFADADVDIELTDAGAALAGTDADMGRAARIAEEAS